MKKRWMSVLICVLLLVTIIPGVANAEGNYGASYATVSGHSERYTDAQFQVLERMVKQANRQIERAVKVAQLTPWNDVPRLMATVDTIVSGVMAYANSIGAIVVCEYTTYYIDGQTVLIDPLRIIRL
ncbi:hypothetical protein SDC9_136771 [bioreactor metagenome]|uniref:Uncharacterized protein n=1 Tax=bioreactor metagenome TaxID=1076179 RepID=A0A645DK27_9ZZZZ|nr:hypothetical protein [Christensenella sp.]